MVTQLLNASSTNRCWSVKARCASISRSRDSSCSPGASATCGTSTRHRKTRQGLGLRHLQAHGRVDPRVLLNEFVLKKRNAPLQCTNDYFLANSRGRTYSVVPRVAGREITPEGLIAIGAVAKKYGLYTKITAAAHRLVRRTGTNCRSSGKS